MKKFDLVESDYFVPFDPDNYQKTKVYQYYAYKYAVWFQFYSYHKAKRDYYNGKPTLSDEEFDRLEEGLKRKYSDIYKKYSSVGFCINTFLAVEIIFNFFSRTFKRRFEDKWNNYVDSKRSSKKKNNDVSIENEAFNAAKKHALENYEQGDQMELFA